MRSLAAALTVTLLAGSSFGAERPAEVLDLSSWMLTLPIDADGSAAADEIKQPTLTTYPGNQWFFVNDGDGGVAFRAHCGGSTTTNSRYPRCELREMTDGGRRRAAWNTDDETAHFLSLRVAITKTPPIKRHVVCAQIHDASDDVLMVRLEGTKLFVERNATGDVMLDERYKLGTPFDLKIESHNGRIRVWYNDVQKLNWQISRRGCYFKAGCYTQSNTDRGDSAESYGEVVLYRLRVEHR